MKFSVATNLQEDFIKKINKKDTYEIFGKLNADFIGGGRNSCILPHVSRERLRAHIKEAHEAGLKFNYLLNASCLGNREFTRHGQKKIHGLLDWLEKIGVDSITVSVPYLLELIKKKYPCFKGCVSLFSGINSLGRAKYWEEMGADLLTLDSISLNRDFQALKKIRQHVKCKLQLIANNSCLCFCPFVLYHSTINAHSSRSCDHGGGTLIDYCILKCRHVRLRDPVNFIRSDWIRPEDLHYYEEVGIDFLKIVDRARATDTIALSLDAYTKRRYDGNLLDLMPAYQLARLFKGRKKLPLVIDYLMGPFAEDIFSLRKLYSMPLASYVYIDNRALDGFLDFFIQNKCNGQGACDECGYCHQVSRNVLRIKKEDREAMLDKYAGFFNKLIK